MRISLRVPLLVAVLTCISTAVDAADANFHIFLCFGQSNMEGGGTLHERDKSVDPRFQILADFDTPARLREYSSMYKPDPKKWSWVTGAMIDIDAIAEQVGLIFSYENNTFNHNLRTVVVGKNGVIRQNFRGNEWKPEDLVQEIVAGAEGKEIPKD